MREAAIQRVGECHCGALKIIAAGEPERVYLCHCKACQRRTGTAFHFGSPSTLSSAAPGRLQDLRASGR
jgi:hypothetical protein